MNLLLGWMEMLVEFSVIAFLFLLAWEWGKRAKGRLLQDTGGSWKGSVGFAEQREVLGSSSLRVEKFLPHPSLISASLHLLSGCGSPPSCTSSKYSSSLSIFLGPLCSHSSCLPSAVPCPALFRLWHPSGFVEEPGEEPAGAGLSGALRHPHSDMAGAALSVSFGRAMSMFALAEKHRLYPPLKGLLCCLCSLLPLVMSIPEAVPAWQPVMSKVLCWTPQSREMLRDRQYLYILIISNITFYPPILKNQHL